MTEAEWLVCDDLVRMVDFLRRRCSERKLRLFEVACCLRLGRFLVPEIAAALATAERFADGAASARQLLAARKAADHANSTLVPEAPERYAAYAAYLAARKTLPGPRAVNWAFRAAVLAAGAAPGSDGPPRWPVSRPDEERAQVALWRDIIGNPFRPSPFEPSWRTSTVVGLAGVVYDQGAFDRLPILADALEDAGCTDRAILDHCRGPGPHVRGCWVVDLILGKQ